MALVGGVISETRMWIGRILAGHLREAKGEINYESDL